MRETDTRSLCDTREREMLILHKMAPTIGVVRECVFNQIVRDLCIRFSPDPSYTHTPQENEEGAVSDNFDCSTLAQTTLVYRTTTTIRDKSHQPETSEELTIDEPQPSSSSEPDFPTLICLALEYHEFTNIYIPQEFRDILARARADNTNKAYRLKWKGSCLWCQKLNIHPILTPPNQILPYLCH